MRDHDVCDLLIAKRGNIWAQLPFIQHKSPEIICSLYVTFFGCLDIGIAIKTLIYYKKRPFEMNRQQNYKGLSFYVEWMGVRSDAITLSLIAIYNMHSCSSWALHFIFKMDNNIWLNVDTWGMWVLFTLVSSCSPTLLIILHNKTSVALTYLLWNINKTQIINSTSLDLGMLIGSACLLVT